MKITEVLLPERIVCRIEEHKLLLGAVYVVVVSAIVVTLIGKAEELSLADSLKTTASAVYTPPKYPISHKAQLAATAQAQAPTISPDTTVWPMHGRVTTEFGVYHRPWQDHHTGIDITSAKRSGVTPVTVFRPGTVIATNRGGNGFGNHVIVDHGNGLTSLYGHLANITVTVGQRVNPGDTIGHEGSTGVSTGPHLHFELRQDGTPFSPRKLEAGNP